MKVWPCGLFTPAIFIRCDFKMAGSVYAVLTWYLFLVHAWFITEDVCIFIIIFCHTEGEHHSTALNYLKINNNLNNWSIDKKCTLTKTCQCCKRTKMLNSHKNCLYFQFLMRDIAYVFVVVVANKKNWCSFTINCWCASYAESIHKFHLLDTEQHVYCHVT